MIVTATTRPLVPVLLILCLCALLLGVAAPAADRDHVIEFRTLRTPTSTVLMTRAGAGYDHARERPSVPSLFTLLPFDSADPDSGHLAAADECWTPQFLWTLAPPDGRSPPIS